MYTLLADFFENVGGFLNVFSYTTTRCGVALCVAFAGVFFLMPKYIAFSKKWQHGGQPIREKYLEGHVSKKGTPTLGGLLVILSTLFSCLLIGDLTNQYMLILIFTIISFGLLGFCDDYKKIKKKDTGGISAKMKLIFQFLFATIAVVAANICIDSPAYSSTLTFPFFRKLVLEIGFLYSIFRIIVIVGSSNAVNLTDGLDGLATIPIIFTSAVFAVFSYVIGNILMAKYLFFDYQNGAQEICVFLSAMIGGLMGFLWYNIKPASIFMGDTGSLAFGAVLGVVSTLIKSEFVLAMAGGLFVLEALSVIMQRYYFKFTHGKRIFKMAPIHHHFEKSGWSEMQVVVRFWIISFFFACIALASLKIR